MTDLDKAIAELRRVTPNNNPNYAATDGLKNTILNAVISGALIPATERDAAVAAALERAEGIATAQEAQANKRQAEADDEAQTDFNAGVLFGTEIGARMIAREIRALITQPQSDALAAVRAEARRVERLAIIAGVDYEASVRPCEEDAVVMRDIARLIAADFSYADADAALADAEGGET